MNIKDILQRKTMLKKSRYIDINNGDISKELDCSLDDVKEALRNLVDSQDIKALTPYGFRGDYALTILESSSIWENWHQ